MGGASDEFPLLAAYNLYAADINGDGRSLPYFHICIGIANNGSIEQVTACSMPYQTRFTATRTIMTRSGLG
jgi:hypothetical protein